MFAEFVVRINYTRKGCSRPVFFYKYASWCGIHFSKEQVLAFIIIIITIVMLQNKA